MSITKIEWADRVWNPVTGCTKISPGCAHCYAEKFAKRLQNNPKAWPKYLNGFAPTMHHNELRLPISWQRPSRIFVCSMADLFHEDIPFEFIDKVMATIAHCFWHTFLVLTKRPIRMLEYFTQAKVNSFMYVARAGQGVSQDDNRMNVRLACLSGIDIEGRAWPLNNLWLGVSAENQQTFDSRVSSLLTIPAVIRFVSLEPLLEEIDIYHQIRYGEWDRNQSNDHTQKLHWVIAGGETGSGARPVNSDWVKCLRYQCHSANIPFFFKHWGGHKSNGRLLNGKEYLQFPKINQLCEALPIT